VVSVEFILDWKL